MLMIIFSPVWPPLMIMLNINLHLELYSFVHQSRNAFELHLQMFQVRKYIIFGSFEQGYSLL